MPYQDISAAELTGFIEREKPVILDMRDDASFTRAHLSGAQMASDSLINELRMRRATHTPLLLYCYHGISSRDLATLLGRTGFKQVYNLEGGWQAWEQFAAGSGLPPSPRLRLWYKRHDFSDPSPFSCNRQGLTPLMLAALKGDQAIVAELLENANILELTNGDGNTALWLACAGEHTDIIRTLVKHGADIDHQNREGATCLIYAASAGKAEVVRTLLELEASLVPATRDGFTAMESAATLPVLRLLRKHEKSLR
jgi:thiosulfate/3-mercaptopyruvate sulfurtransferase